MPNPLGGHATYVYEYGPVSFYTLFPCASNLLVWGRGTQTTSGLWKSAVHIGQGSDVYGNVGSRR